MSGGEPIRVSRPSGVTRRIDVAGSQILTESHHSTAGIESIAKSRAAGSGGSGGLRLTNARFTELISFASSNEETRNNGGRSYA